MAGQPVYRAFQARVAERGGEAAILERIALGEWMKDIAADYGVSYRTLKKWIDESEERRDLVDQAKAMAAESHVADAMRLVDDANPESPAGVTKAKEQARIRQWLAAKLDRRTFGDDPSTVVGVNVDLGELHLDALRQGGHMDQARELEAEVVE